jgi:hypothetical protein
LIQITREPGKTAKFFVVLISIAAIAIILTGGAFVYPQQVNEAKKRFVGTGNTACEG